MAYEGGNAWADMDSSLNVSIRRVYLGGYDSLVARIGSSNNEDWYLTDNIGSVRDMVNYLGSAIYHADFSVFGTPQNETNPSNGDRYKYTSREWEAEAEIQYNRARYLQYGRWMSQDPLGFEAGDSNLYRYVTNNPITLTDGMGLQSRDNPIIPWRQMMDPRNPNGCNYNPNLPQNKWRHERPFQLGDLLRKPVPAPAPVQVEPLIKAIEDNFNESAEAKQYLDQFKNAGGKIQIFNNMPAPAVLNKTNNIIAIDTKYAVNKDQGTGYVLFELIRFKNWDQYNAVLQKVFTITKADFIEEQEQLTYDYVKTHHKIVEKVPNWGPDVDVYGEKLRTKWSTFKDYFNDPRQAGHRDHFGTIYDELRKAGK